MKKELFLLLLSILFGAVFCVTLIVLYYPLVYPDIVINDEILHHKLLPNIKFKMLTPNYNNLTEMQLGKNIKIFTKKTNSFGFVDDEIDINDPSKKRILLLGDSFTEGAYIENNFADILENKLKNVEVINAGIGSYSPMIEYNLLKYIGLKFKPEIVILNLDMTDVSNDFSYTQDDFWIRENDFINIKKDSYFFKKVRIKLKKAFERIIDISKKIFKKQDMEELKEAVLDTMQKKQTDAGDINKDYLYAYTHKDEFEFKGHLEKTFNYINKIANLCKENEVDFILHIYPHSLQISEGYSCYRELRGLEVDKIYSNVIFDETFSFAKENGIELWSSKEALQTALERPYYLCDMHFNEYGHEIIANFFFDKLKEKNL